MATMKDIITSPLLLILVIVGLLYIVGFSLVYLKKAYKRCLELGISKEEIQNVMKSSVFFSIVPSLSIVVGLFALISILGTVWSWWRLSVIGSLSYESLISSSVASAQNHHLRSISGMGSFLGTYRYSDCINLYDFCPIYCSRCI